MCVCAVHGTSARLPRTCGARSTTKVQSVPLIHVWKLVQKPTSWCEGSMSAFAACTSAEASSSPSVVQTHERVFAAHAACRNRLSPCPEPLGSSDGAELRTGDAETPRRGSVTSTPNFIKPVCQDVYTTRLRDANTAARFVTVFPGKMAFRPYRSPHAFPNAHTHLSHRPLCDLITLRLDHLTKATSSACGVRRRGVSSDVLADVT